MAASVESAFILIDRASGPVRSIKRELRDLRLEAERTGAALDEVSGPRQARQLEQLDRETRVFGNDMRDTGREVDRGEASMRRYEQRTTSVTKETKKARIELSALGKIVGWLKWPALIAGAGGAVQVLGALTAGTVALLPKLTDLGSLAASGGVLMAGLAGGMGVAKLASMGLSKALGGNKKAMQDLTPQGRAVVQMLRSLKPEIDRLQSTAQRGLFPGVSSLLGNLKAQAPQIRGIVGQQSKDLGGLAAFLGRRIGSGNFMGELRQLSDESGRALGAAARSGFFFAQAVEHILVAAGPFTDWLGNSVEHLAKLADHEAEAAKESGRLDEWFRRARTSVSELADTGKHVFGVLTGVMRAARGESDSLWGSIDKATKRWDHWTNSVTGQTTMRRWFDDMRPALTATVQLVGDLGKVIGHLSEGTEGAQMITALDKALPSIESGVSSLTSSLGPAVVDAFGSFVHLLGDAGGQAGPLTLLARAVGTLANDADHLIQALGPAGHAIATALLTFGLARKLKVFDVLDMLRLKWQGVGDAAVVAGAQERAAMGLGGGGGAGVVPVGAGGAGGGGIIPFAAGGAASATAAEAEAVSGRGVAGLGEFSPGVSVAPLGEAPIAAEAAAGGGAGILASGIGGSGAARGALGVGARFVAPLAAINGALQAFGTPGGIGPKAQGFASGASFGLVPGPVSLAQKQAKGATFAGQTIDKLNNGSSFRRQRKTISGLRSTITRLPGNDAFDNNSSDLATATRALQRELHRREQILHDAEHQEVLSLRETSVRKAEAMTTDFSKAYAIRAKHDGPEAAMRHSVSAVLNEMRKMNPAGRKVLGDNMLAWAKEQAHQNPKLRGQYIRLEQDIKDSFSRTGKHVSIVNGQILTGSTTEWKSIRLAMTTQTEQAREDTSKDFTAIQQQAIGSLTAMGFSTGEARTLVQAMENGGSAAKQASGVASAQGAIGGVTAARGKAKKKRASGGRLPGRGLADTVPMSDGGYGAPGELVVNRHTEGKVDEMLGMFGTRLDRMVANETRPHSRARARGGRVGGANFGGHPSNVSPGIASLIGFMEKKFPKLSVTSTTDHSLRSTSGGISFHSSGRAVDMAADPAYMHHVADWINTSGFWRRLTEGIHNPNLSVKNNAHVPSSFWGPAVWGEHLNHIHMALAGGFGSTRGLGASAGGGVGGAAASVARSIGALHSPLSRVGGLPGAAADVAGALYAAGLTNRINRHLGGGHGGGGGVGNVGGLQQYNHVYAANGGAMLSPEVIAQIFSREGLPGKTFAQIAHGESSYEPGEIEPSEGPGIGGVPVQGYGLVQITTGVGNDKMIASMGGPRAMLNPFINARAARKLYDDAGHSISPWHGTKYVSNAETGKRLGAGPDWGGWNSKGGDFTVRRPTVFGAGENGMEHVSIRPAGRGGGGGLSFSPTVHVNVAGSRMRAYVEKRLEEFAHTLADELEHGLEEDEGALIS